MAENTNDIDILNSSVSSLGSSKANTSDTIKNITRSGTTFTATRANGTTFTFNQQDNNTTYGFYYGSVTITAGTSLATGNGLYNVQAYQFQGTKSFTCPSGKTPIAMIPYGITANSNWWGSYTFYDINLSKKTFSIFARTDGRGGTGSVQYLVIYQN